MKLDASSNTLFIYNPVLVPGRESWLKLDAPLNMPDIYLTLEVSQEERGWLKLDTPANIWLISVTLDVSQSERGWLKLDAP